MTDPYIDMNDEETRRQVHWIAEVGRRTGDDVIRELNEKFRPGAAAERLEFAHRIAAMAPCRPSEDSAVLIHETRAER